MKSWMNLNCRSKMARCGQSALVFVLLGACSAPQADVSSSESAVTPQADVAGAPRVDAVSPQAQAVASQTGPVEITLVDELDGIKSGYCLDIARGQKADANPANGLQAHTCYSHEGELAIDQIFDASKLADEQLFMPEFDVCATVSAVELDATVGLAACDGSETQRLVLSAAGKISPVADSSLCVTAADETRTGRSETNLMRALSLQSCSDGLAATQVWRTRSEDDRAG